MRRTPTGPLAGLSLLLLLATVATGCRQGTFFGERYNNFRAYYNTFYNARKAFEEGEEQLVRLDERIDRSRFLPVFADVPSEGGGARAGGTGGPFQSAIDKSADLLRERPDSKWADDALLLIGRSYFYQRNLVGAEAKFRETIAAAEERGQGELTDEARYWLGRTLAAQERYEEAVSVIEEGLAREGLARRWRARMQLALAEQYVQQREWAAAAEALRAGLDDLRDADLAGRASFLLGQVLEAGGDVDGAAEAYRAVERYRPYYELLYAAQLSRARVLGLDAGRHDEALALIRRMRRDDKNFQNRAEVELTYARLLAAAGRHDEARDRFEALLYEIEEGEEFAGVSVPRSETHYYYGAFYRDRLDDYVRAAAYLDTAATGLRTDPGREALVTRAALTGVRREAD
ncbi:MAG: tetratricopeptide repeat protein, partial [Rubricoccaceae bacterium]|nr:tetratricopeptide repeat protein [Rubricoccaceae bacterium]